MIGAGAGLEDAASEVNLQLVSYPWRVASARRAVDDAVDVVGRRLRPFAVQKGVLLSEGGIDDDRLPLPAQADTTGIAVDQKQVPGWPRRSGLDVAASIRRRRLG